MICFLSCSKCHVPLWAVDDGLDGLDANIHILDLYCDQVCDWVEYLGLLPYKKKFLHNLVDGRIALQLTNADLKARTPLFTACFHTVGKTSGGAVLCCSAFCRKSRTLVAAVWQERVSTPSYRGQTATCRMGALQAQHCLAEQYVSRARRRTSASVR